MITGRCECRAAFVHVRKEAIMCRVSLIKVSAIGVALVVLSAAPLFAQESNWENPPGYVSAVGAAVWTGGNSTGSVLFEGGGRIAPPVVLFGHVGRFNDLQKDLDPSLTTATTTLSDQGIGVNGGGRCRPGMERGECARSSPSTSTCSRMC